MPETVEERARRLGLAPAETVEQRAARLGLTRSAPTGHNGVPFVDAKPEEPSYAEKVSGGIASLGRFIAPDLQAGARAVTRDRGVLDFVKELKNTKGSDVLSAVKYGPFGVGKLTTAAMERTPSFARAQDDIQGAEESSGGVGQFNGAVGAAVGLSQMAGPVRGAVRGGMAPLIAKLRGGLGGRMAEGAWSGLTKSTPAAVSKAEGLQSPMDAVLESIRAQKAPPTTTPAESPTMRAARKWFAKPQAGSPLDDAPQWRHAGVAFDNASSSTPSPLEATLARVRPAGPQEAVPDMAARQSHRTAAQFRHFAEEYQGQAPRPTSGGPVAPPPKSALDAQLEELLAKAKQFNPTEVGATYGDAEEAMGLAPHQQPDLEDLLRRSLDLAKQKKR